MNIIRLGSAIPTTCSPCQEYDNRGIIAFALFLGSFTLHLC